MATPDPRVQRPKPLAGAVPSPHPGYHRIRKLIHLVCFFVFMALPFSDVMRFDIPRQRFYFFGVELWISEFAVIFFALMFLMFLIVASSVIYGRVYCGYLCPQMIFSEASIALESWLARKINKKYYGWPAPLRKRAAAALWSGAVGLASVFLAFIFISYFVQPRDLLARLMSFDIHTAGGIAGAVVTLVTLLDFTLVRQKFCTTVCPYGYLQGMLGDSNTLLVHYRDEGKDCIECKKCVRVCHMGIDIRTSPYQIECIHCGECIDACEDVLRRFGKQGLIHYAWGESGAAVAAEKTWYRKLGMRDAKRVVVLLVVLFYLSGLTVALSMRRAVLVQLQPVRASLYRLDAAGRVHNTFRLKLANRGKRDAASFSHMSSHCSRLTLSPNPVPLRTGEVVEREFDVTAARFAAAQEVNQIRITARAAGESSPDVFEETFLMPPGEKKP